MDPPAYTPTIPSPPTTTRRTIEDTRALILANASIFKQKAKDYQPIDLVVGKTRSAADVAAGTINTRSFVSQTSNVTIRINDGPATTSSSDASPERRVSDHDSARVVGKHYAALIYRTGAARQEIKILIKGEPQDTVEEALDWMLDKTEMEFRAVLGWKRPETGDR